MKTKYVEPKGYWSREMEKAFNEGKKSPTRKSKSASKRKRGK